MSGIARLMSNGLKKILKNGFSSTSLSRLPDCQRWASILPPAGPGHLFAGSRGPHGSFRSGCPLLEDGQLRGVERQPLRAQLADRAVREQLLDRLVDGGAERVAL